MSACEQFLISLLKQQRNIVQWVLSLKGGPKEEILKSNRSYTVTGLHAAFCCSLFSGIFEISNMTYLKKERKSLEERSQLPIYVVLPMFHKPALILV